MFHTLHQKRARVYLLFANSPFAALGTVTSKTLADIKTPAEAFLVCDTTVPF